MKYFKRIIIHSFIFGPYLTVSGARYKYCLMYPQRSRTMATKKCITLDNMNPYIKKMQYAVRGPVPARAVQLYKELLEGAKKPFTKVTKANLGDCHAMGQIPITFVRQVMAAVGYPQIMETTLVPKDVSEKAKIILSGCRGNSAGSYTDSLGIEPIRRHVAEYIERRDGHPSNWQDILLSSGASDGIKSIFKLLIGKIDGKKPGIMIPYPQYPLYTATISEFDMYHIGYYLNEENNWSLEVEELERALKEARPKCNPRGIVIINPGNPTGQVLTRNNLENAIKFAYKENLVIMSDEVYQDNVYDPESKFYSMKKVMRELGPPYSEMELCSFMSGSKGYMGECGFRGGCVEIANFDEGVKMQLYKLQSTLLCPSVFGQSLIDCLARPPRPGEESYDLFNKEKTFVLDSLKHRAKLVADTFNSVEGFKCQKVQGAMYAFPRLLLPEKAVKKAESIGQHPDLFYTFQLLEETGICVVPGSGFGQKPGTYHFRTTILPQISLLNEMMEAFRKFHQKFLKQYS